MNGHHILFTSGKNPVPCLVGVARLISQSREETGCLPYVTAIAAGRKEPPELAAIRDLLFKRFSEKSFWRLPWLLPDAYDPVQILAGIRARLPELGAPDSIAPALHRRDESHGGPYRRSIG